MTLAEQIYQHSLHLPEEAAKQALAFVEFLEHRHAANDAAAKTARRQAGSAKDTLVILADDDDHLADFSNYMQ